MLTITEALSAAIDHHRAGRLSDAEALYRSVLEVAPDNVDALHLLGCLAHQVGRNDLAVEYIGTAIGLNDGMPDFHWHLGLSFEGLGRVDDAIGAYRRAIGLAPTADRYLQFGGMLASIAGVADAASDHAQALTRLDEADACFDRAVILYREGLSLGPDDANSRHKLGFALMQLGNYVGIGLKPKNYAVLSEARACLSDALIRTMNLDSFLVLGDLGGIDDVILVAGARFARDELRANPFNSGAICALLYYVYRRRRLDLMSRLRQRMLRPVRAEGKLPTMIAGRPALWTLAMVRADTAFFDGLARCTIAPDIIGAVAEGTSPIVLVTGDDVYVRTYADEFIASVAAHGDAVPVHLHIMDPSLETMAFADRYMCSFEDTTNIRPEYRTIYYTCGRFFVLSEMLKKVNRPVIITDIDMVCLRDPASLVTDHEGVDIGITAENGRRGPHIDLCARFIYVNNTPRSRHYIDLVCRYIAHYLIGGESSWMLDQCALYSVHEFLDHRGEAPTLRRWDVETFDIFQQRKLPKVAGGDARQTSLPARVFTVPPER